MKESDNDYLNNKNPEVKSLGIKSPYIICAAIWFNDEKEHEHQPRNIRKGIVICGRRHHNILLTVKDLKGLNYIQSECFDVDQGFMTSDDVFVNREEAGIIAHKAGQTKKLKEVLFSEDIY